MWTQGDQLVSGFFAVHEVHALVTVRFSGRLERDEPLRWKPYIWSTDTVTTRLVSRLRGELLLVSFVSRLASTYTYSQEWRASTMAS